MRWSVLICLFVCSTLAGAQELVFQRGHSQPITQALIDPTFRYLVTGDGRGLDLIEGTNGSIRLWDLRTGLLDRALFSTIGSVNRMAFTPNGKFLLAMSDSFSAVWQVETGQLVGLIDGPSADIDPHTGQIIALVRVRGADKKSLVGWQIQTLTLDLKPLVSVPIGLVSTDTMAVVPPDVMCFEDTRDLALIWAGKVCVVDRATAVLKSTAKLSGGDVLFKYKVRAGGHKLFFASHDFSSVDEFDADQSDRIVRMEWKGRSNLIGPFALLAGAHPKIVYKTNGGFRTPSVFKVWDSETGAESALTGKGSSTTSGALAILPKTNVVYAGNSPFDITTGLSLANPFTTNSFPGRAELSGNDVFIGASGHDFTAQACVRWNMATGSVTAIDPLGSYSMDVNASGTCVNRDSSTPVVSVLPKAGAPTQFSLAPIVHPVGFSPDGAAMFAGDIAYSCKTGNTALFNSRRVTPGLDYFRATGSTMTITLSTDDRKRRAYDTTTGKLIWTSPLTDSGSMDKTDSIISDCWPASANEIVAIVQRLATDGTPASDLVWYDVRTNAQVARVACGNASYFRYVDCTHRYLSAIPVKAGNFQPENELIVVDLVQRKVVVDSSFQLADVTSIGGSGGAIWVGTSHGDIWSASGTTPAKRLTHFNGAIHAIYSLASGKLLVGLTDSLEIGSLSSPTFLSCHLPIGTFGEWNAIQSFADGSIAIATDTVLAKISSKGNVVESRSLPEFDSGTFIRLSPDGSTLAAIGKGAVVLWDVSRRLPTFSSSLEPSNYVTATYGPNGKFYIASDGGHSVTVFDSKLQILKRWRIGFIPADISVSSADSRVVCVGSYIRSGAFKFWLPDAPSDSPGNSLVVPPYLSFNESLNCCRFSPDGKTIALGGEAGDVAIKSPDGAKNISTFRASTSPITSVSFSPDGSSLLVGSTGDLAGIWNLKTGKSMLKLGAVGHEDFIAQAPNGSLLMTPGAASYFAVRYGGELFPLGVLEPRFNRPQDVLASLGIANSRTIQSYASAYKSWLGRSGQSGEDFKPEDLPSIEIENAGSTPRAGANPISLSVHTASVSSQLKKLVVTVNGVQLAEGVPAVPSGTKDASLTIGPIWLSSGRDVIEVKAIDVKGRASLADRFVARGPVAKFGSSKAYFVGLGVSEYADSSHNLRYADKDVVAMSDQLGSTLYGNLKPLVLTNHEVTRGTLQQVKKAIAEATIDDEVILHFAGHGVRGKNGSYYFAASDTVFSEVEKTGISFDEIEDLVASSKARKRLILLDTCFAGDVEQAKPTLCSLQQEKRLAPGVVARSVEATKSPLNPMDESFWLAETFFPRFREGSGAQVIAAASGSQVSFETEEVKHGLFTYAALEALQSLSKGTNSLAATVDELRRYIFKRVRELSNGYQIPMSKSASAEYDFSIVP